MGVIIRYRIYKSPRIFNHLMEQRASSGRTQFSKITVTVFIIERTRETDKPLKHRSPRISSQESPVSTESDMYIN